MNGADPLYIFLVAATCGAACGGGYDLLCALRAPVRLRPVVFFTDLLFGGLCAVLWLFVSSSLGFPSLRLYHLLAGVAGFALYRKSLHKIVAFFAKKLYNKVKQLRRGRKTCPEEEAKVSPKKK